MVMRSRHAPSAKQNVDSSVDDGAARRVHQLTQRCSATPGTLNELLSNVLAAFVIATVWQRGTYFFKHNVQIRLDTFVKLIHAELPQDACRGYAKFSPVA
jgi:hypothetical protein